MKEQFIQAYGDNLIQGTYRFHSGFVKIDNFINENAQFISLTSDETFLSANCIVISQFNSGSYQELTVENDNILFNKQSYPLISKRQYNSTFHYPEISLHELQHRIETFRKCHLSLFPPHSLIFLLNNTCSEMNTSAFRQAYAEKMHHACSLFKTNFFESIRLFKASGIGLTPSGDDFIAGVLYGIDCLQSLTKQDYTEIRQQVLELSRTKNIFSSNMLYLAYHARYFKRLKDVLESLFYVTSHIEQTQLKTLFSVGETSGADILSGYFTFLVNIPDIFNINYRVHD